MKSRLGDHGSTPWAYALFHRPSAGWALKEELLEGALDEALAGGLAIDGPELCKALTAVEEPSLLCAVMGAHCRHLTTEGCLILLEMLAKRGASFTGPDPIKALASQRCWDEAQPDPAPVLRALLAHGANPLLSETPHTRDWAASRLADEGDEEAAEFLRTHAAMRREHAALEQDTQRVDLPRTSPRF